MKSRDVFFHVSLDDLLEQFPYAVGRGAERPNTVEFYFNNALQNLGILKTANITIYKAF